MAKDGRKAAIGIGIGVVAGLGIYLATRKAEAVPPPEPEPGLATLYGIVIDAITGNAISGVSITLDGYSTPTKGAGDYAFANLTPGSYSITFQKGGYEMNSQDITLHEGLNVLDIALTPIIVEPTFATLYGKVTDGKSGAALAGVTVSLLSPGGAELLAQMTTDSGGNYRWENILPGNYIVVFEKAGYESATR